MAFSTLTKHKQTILYGIVLALMLYLLRWLKVRFIIFNNAFEIYAGAIAVIFIVLGIWLAQKLIKPKVETIVIEKQVL